MRQKTAVDHARVDCIHAVDYEWLFFEKANPITQVDNLTGSPQGKILRGDIRSLAVPQFREFGKLLGEKIGAHVGGNQHDLSDSFFRRRGVNEASKQNAAAHTVCQHVNPPPGTIGEGTQKCSQWGSGSLCAVKICRVREYGPP